ncbi:hypothetical protein V6N12_033029 [Hibiscus sabdariffa]|uniref:Uncharacterized protein n=1 Tax=Hibiscus sabdariffa TaxID=183260 RepID=A0ABR2CF87_9ROSI
MVRAWIRVRVLNRITWSNFSQKGKPLFLFIFTISFSSNLRELSTGTLAHHRRSAAILRSAAGCHSGNCSGEPKPPFKSPVSLFSEDRFGTIEGGPKRSSQGLEPPLGSDTAIDAGPRTIPMNQDWPSTPLFLLCLSVTTTTPEEV